MTVSEQTGIRCVLMRGGTSKGLYFHEADLPRPGPRRDAMLLRLMGSPDVLQIDGLGGSRPITSKAAIIAPSAHGHADVDYTFAQAEIDRAGVGYAGNCGNISSGVGPFAVDEGLVEALEPVTRVRIFNTNTQALIVAEVPVRDGRARVDRGPRHPRRARHRRRDRDELGRHDRRQDGPPSAHRPAVDEFTLETGATVQATLCDAGNPCVWVPADRTRPHRQRARRRGQRGRRPDRHRAGNPGQGRRPHGTGDRLVTGRRAVAGPADGRARRAASGLSHPIRGPRSRRSRWICGSGCCS